MDEQSTSDSSGTTQEQADLNLSTVGRHLFNAQLDQAIKEQKDTTIYLVNGIRLIGVPLAYDEEVILFPKAVAGKPMVVQRAAVATFVPFGADPGKSQTPTRK